MLSIVSTVAIIVGVACIGIGCLGIFAGMMSDSPSVGTEANNNGCIHGAIGVGLVILGIAGITHG